MADRYTDTPSGMAQEIADLRAENASLRQRLADLGDLYQWEREARQRLVAAGGPVGPVLVQFQRLGVGMAEEPSIDDMAHLVERLAPEAFAAGWRIIAHDTVAVMRLTIARGICEDALYQAWEILRGRGHG